jgi:hypothetical protein
MMLVGVCGLIVIYCWCREKEQWWLMCNLLLAIADVERKCWHRWGTRYGLVVAGLFRTYQLACKWYCSHQTVIGPFLDGFSLNDASYGSITKKVPHLLGLYINNRTPLWFSLSDHDMNEGCRPTLPYAQALQGISSVSHVPLPCQRISWQEHTHIVSFFTIEEERP